MLDYQRDTIYRKVYERRGHALGLARINWPMSIAVACACGFEDTWLPHESSDDVAKRFNAHLKAKP